VLKFGLIVVERVPLIQGEQSCPAPSERGRRGAAEAEREKREVAMARIVEENMIVRV